MIFKTDPSLPKPMYRQIVDQVKYAVASGRLREGDRLGSIRDVAVQTRVNRNTVARAYMELEREGAILTRTGQGSFVAEGGAPAVTKARARRILSERIDDVLAQARQFQLSGDDVVALVKKRLEKVDL